MFERLTTTLAVAVIALGVGITGALADKHEKATMEKVDEGQVAAASAQVELGRQVLDYGVDNGDALSIVNGVRLMKAAGGNVLADGEEKGDGKKFDYLAALNKAAGLAKDDAAMTKIIDDTKALVAKDPKWGRACWWRRICGWRGCFYRYWCVHW